jgi:putative nucleotidyltransferase with HDIG domain
MSGGPELSAALGASAAVAAARAALRREMEAWIVGGAIRDAALGEPVTDVDLAVAPGEEQRAARAIARLAGGHAFPLSLEHSTWRAVVPTDAWHADVGALRGATIEADLLARDFTVNAIALPLGDGEPIDPAGGLNDARERRLRAVSDRAFGDDPLRVMRAARLAARYGLELDPGTAALARRAAPRATEPAGERQFAELRAIVTGPDPMRGLELLGELEALPVVLPEVAALSGVEQNPYHHLDVHGHTLAVLAETVSMETRLPDLFGPLAPALAELLAEPLADQLDRREALRFGALLHDIGKPATRRIGEGGRVLFLGHDRLGAEMVGEVCRRLRTSRALVRHLQLLTLHHLRLGFLVHQRPLSRRTMYDYLLATDPAPVDVTLLTVADRLATRGPRTRDEAIDSHLELAQEMLAEALVWQQGGAPAPPVSGDRLATELGVAPGPQIGRLLEELRAATFAGEVEGRDEAIELARELLAR